jgi:hypothetical protein
MVEQSAVNRKDVGSSPTESAEMEVFQQKLAVVKVWVTSMNKNNHPTCISPQGFFNFQSLSDLESLV